DVYKRQAWGIQTVLTDMVGAQELYFIPGITEVAACLGQRYDQARLLYGTHFRRRQARCCPRGAPPS
ncbi:MAG: hypothetical protein N2Z74_03145, partial [Syntrophales bacterium]|nr:hypothetical protein [Syntrophales bacterium]